MQNLRDDFLGELKYHFSADVLLRSGATTKYLKSVCSSPETFENIRQNSLNLFLPGDYDYVMIGTFLRGNYILYVST